MKSNQRENVLPLMKPQNTSKRTTGINVEDSDPLVFEKHFGEYWPSIYRLLFHMLGDPSEAEDLALETFYRLYQQRPSSKPEFKVAGWLFRVATNLALHSIRRYKRREYYELNAYRDVLMEERNDDPIIILDEKEKIRLARIALAKMNPRQSQLLVLRYSGMAYKEIAESLELSPSSIGPLLVRAEREFEKYYRTLDQEVK